MTSITLPRATVEQALEALEKTMNVWGGTCAWHSDVKHAITALRAALAQQDEPRNQCGETCERAKLCATCAQALAQQAEPVEPVAWDVTKNGRLIYDYDFTHDVSLRVMGDFEDDEQRVRYAKQIVDKLNAALAQQAEPVEPVAWRSENANPPGGYVIFQQYPQALADLGKPIQPLYTAPPQRKLVPLTAQELDGVIERHVGGSEITDDMYTSMEQFARAAIKTVKEGK